MTKLFTIALLTLSSSAYAADSLSLDNDLFYIGFDIGYSEGKFESGGHNTLGDFRNTNDDKDRSPAYNLHIGKDFGIIRTEISLAYRHDFDMDTDSFAPPTPTFFYDSEISSSNLMFSLFFEPFEWHNFTPYAGGGIGASRVAIKTDDNVVKGDDDQINFAWQAEGGVAYTITDNLGLKLGYRYVDLGNTEISLRSKTGGIDAGDFSGSLHTHEGYFGIQYSFD